MPPIERCCYHEHGVAVVDHHADEAEYGERRADAEGPPKAENESRRDDQAGDKPHLRYFVEEGIVGLRDSHGHDRRHSGGLQREQGPNRFFASESFIGILDFRR